MTLEKFQPGKGYYFNSHDFGERKQFIAVAAERNESDQVTFVLVGKLLTLPATIIEGREFVQVRDSSTGATYGASAAITANVSEAHRVLAACEAARALRTVG